MPTVRDWLSASAVNGKIYAIGGEFVANPNDMRTIFSTVEEYDPGTSGQSTNHKGKLPTTWGDVRTALNK